MAFQVVSREEFLLSLVDCGASPFFTEQMTRLDLRGMPDEGRAAYQIHYGPLTAVGSVQIPAHFTLMVGDVRVGGLLDAEDAYGEGGALFVVGDVHCGAFSSQPGKSTMIDGDLTARDILINAFSDSALVVIGDLRTNFFYGRNAWTGVGGQVRMQAGEGSCRPIDSCSAIAHAVRPDLGEADSRDLLLPSLRDELDQTQEQALVERVRFGVPLFR
jgi:hypothetical protein